MAVNGKTLTPYAMLPNYRNYWKEAGFVEMDGVGAALEQEIVTVSNAFSPTGGADTTLFGSATEVRDGIEAWFDSGIKTPIVVPSSANGGQMVAFEEILGIF